MTVDLCITNARISAGSEIVDVCVAIDDGKIKKVCKKSSVPKADEVIDAHGMLLLPGAIDVHVHFRDPGQTHKEDWSTGSKAFAAGGVTTVFDMPNNQPKPTTSLEAIAEKKKEAKRKSIINYGVYCGVVPKNLKKLQKIAPHVCGFKLYMGETTGSLAVCDRKFERSAVKAVSETNRVLVVHAEDHESSKKAFAENKDKRDMLAHTRSHPPESEVEGVRQILGYARDFKARVHLTHLSTAGSAVSVYEAKKEGLAVSCDTTCHYLLLNQSKMLTGGTIFKVTPPLRTAQDQTALWSAIASNVIDLVASDHAPHTLEEKAASIWDSCSGIPSGNLTVPLLFNEVNNKRLTLNRFIELTSQNPALAFKMKNKGFLLEGFDADLMLVDPKMEKTVKSEDMYSKCGWTPYEGWTLAGWPMMTFVSGRRVYDDGIIFDEVKGREVRQAK